jgi:hypothetical protein
MNPEAKSEAQSIELLARMLQLAIQENDKDAVKRYVGGIGQKLNKILEEIIQ